MIVTLHVISQKQSGTMSLLLLVRVTDCFSFYQRVSVNV